MNANTGLMNQEGGTHAAGVSERARSRTGKDGLVS